MKLYFSPLACSLASRIAFYEAARRGPRAAVQYVEVDPGSNWSADGSDYRGVHALGLVPALQLDDGQVLSENAAILQYIADLHPHARLAPVDALGRARLRQWLSFIGSELHVGVYSVLLSRSAPEGARRHALNRAERRLAWLSDQLGPREFLLPEFSVADGYLGAVLNWSSVTPLALARWPVVEAYAKRLQARPAVAQALSEELELYRQKRQRDGAPPSVPGTEAVMARFNDVFQQHDPSALEQLVADDCVIENTQPAPDGSRHVGRSACIQLWSSIASATDIQFELEGVEVFDQRATIYWRLLRTGGTALRGVNLMRVRDGQIVEARGYVKGV